MYLVFQVAGRDLCLFAKASWSEHAGVDDLIGIESVPGDSFFYSIQQLNESDQCGFLVARNERYPH